MGKPSSKTIQDCKDPFVREPLLAGADLNDFCTGCLTNTAHEACTGKSGMVAGQGFSVKCVCDCPTAKAKREADNG